MAKINFESQILRIASTCQFTKFKNFLPGYSFYGYLIWNPQVKNSITNLTINLDTLSQRTLSICAISSLGTLMIPYSNFRCPGQLASQFSTELHIQYTCGWIMVYLTFSIIYLFTYIRRNLGTNRTFYSNRFAILRSKLLKNQ